MATTSDAGAKPKAHKLARAKGKLRKKLAAGFDRVVFAAPGAATPSAAEAAGDGATPLADEVHAGPAGPLTDADFEQYFEHATRAAQAGRVKHTWVLDDTKRIEVDARHGFLKARTLDAATVDKVMGGKDRPLRPDRSAALLRAIGIMNADGSIPARRAKKYKQVNHLVALAQPSLDFLAGRTR